MMELYWEKENDGKYRLLTTYSDNEIASVALDKTSIDQDLWIIRGIAFHSDFIFADDWESAKEQALAKIQHAHECESDFHAGIVEGIQALYAKEAETHAPA